MRFSGLRPLVLVSFLCAACGGAVTPVMTTVPPTLLPSPTASQTPSPSPISTSVPLPTATSIASLTLTPMFSLTATAFFANAPNPTHVTGVFVSADTTPYPNTIPAKEGQCYDVFRFYQDGGLIGQSICLEGKETISDAWPDIRQWFYRGNPRTVIGSGKYKLSGGHITFTTTRAMSTQPDVVVDYSGIYYGVALVLDTHSHATDYRRTSAIYYRQNLE